MFGFKRLVTFLQAHTCRVRLFFLGVLMLLLALSPLRLHGAGTNSPVILQWTWGPQTSDLGGLSVADYMTNVWFEIRSSTNIVLDPLTWPVLTNVPGSPFPLVLATNQPGWIWTVTNAADAQTRFYIARAADSRGFSPFSNVAVDLALPPSGTLSGRH